MIQKNVEILCTKKYKNIKITKREHAFKGYASNYNIEILNAFNPELQLKDTDSAIKSKLIELLTESRGFKFVTTLVLYYVHTYINFCRFFNFWRIYMNQQKLTGVSRSRNFYIFISSHLLRYKIMFSECSRDLLLLKIVSEKMLN